MERLTRDRRRPGTAGGRLARAVLALFAGLVAAALVLALGLPLLGKTDTSTIVIVAPFAALGWALTVVPLVLFADHRTRFFSPRAAPLVGALCGAVILYLVFTAWSGTPLWALAEPVELDVFVLLGVAAVTGAAIWTVYTVLASRI